MKRNIKLLLQLIIKVSIRISDFPTGMESSCLSSSVTSRLGKADGNIANPD